MTSTYAQIVQKKMVWNVHKKQNAYKQYKYIFQEWGKGARQTGRQTEGEKGHKWNKYETLVNPLKGYTTVPYILLAIFLFLVFYQSKNISKKEKKRMEGRKKRRKERKERREGRKEGKKEGRKRRKRWRRKRRKRRKEGRVGKKGRKDASWMVGWLVVGIIAVRIVLVTQPRITQLLKKLERLARILPAR